MRVLGNRMREYIDFQGADIAPIGTPIPLHGVNPRQTMSDHNWDKVRKDTYRKFNYKCAVCGDVGMNQGFSHPVEAHEIWDYDFKNEIQYFEGLVALCPVCHKVIHWEQNKMALRSGQLSQKEFERQEELKVNKMYELYGKRITPTRKKPHRWHDGEWKSDFTKMKELYPEIDLKITFDSKWSGFFSREKGSYLYKPIKDPLQRLF